jgi:hypothetical protein
LEIPATACGRAGTTRAWARGHVGPTASPAVFRPDGLQVTTSVRGRNTDRLQSVRPECPRPRRVVWPPHAGHQPLAAADARAAFPGRDVKSFTGDFEGGKHPKPGGPTDAHPFPRRGRRRDRLATT